MKFKFGEVKKRQAKHPSTMLRVLYIVLFAHQRALCSLPVCNALDWNATNTIER